MIDGHRRWMREAVDLAKQSRIEERPDPAPKVGAVIVKDGQRLGGAFRGESDSGDHAEYGLLKRLDGVDLTGSTVYTTLEPCSRRKPNKTPCAQRLVSRGVAVVYIGMYDPNPVIYREGWRVLRDGGVQIRDFPADLRAEIAADNHEFRDTFRLAKGDRGTARFDYQTSADHIVQASGETFETHWTHSGSAAIWAYNFAYNDVALARYARNFDEIDDPSSLHYSASGLEVPTGSIVVFRGQHGFLLVKVVDIEIPNGGSGQYQLSIEFEARVGLADRSCS